MRSKFAVAVILMFLLFGLSSCNYYRSHRPKPQRSRWQEPQSQLSYRPRQQDNRYRSYPHQEERSRGQQLRTRDTEDQGNFQVIEIFSIFAGNNPGGGRVLNIKINNNKKSK